MPKLTEAEIAIALENLPDWQYVNNTLHKTFTAPSFGKAIAFVLDVAVKAEQHNHHPNIDIRYNKVIISTSTHDVGGFVTEKDVALAQDIEHASKY